MKKSFIAPGPGFGFTRGISKPQPHTRMALGHSLARSLAHAQCQEKVLLKISTSLSFGGTINASARVGYKE